MKWVYITMFCMFLLLLSSSVVLGAKETKIVDGWVAYDEQIIKNKDIYTIRLIYTDLNKPEESMIRIKKNDDQLRMIVPFGTCERNEYYEYCFKNYTVDHTKATIDDRGILQPAIQLTLKEFELGSDLTITRIFEKTSLKKFETTQVTITAENKAEKPITNVQLIETIPSEYNIEKVSDELNKVENTLSSRTFNLYPGKSWTGTYTIKSNEYGDVQYATQATFINHLGEEKTKTSSNTKLTTQSPYTLTINKLKNVNRNDRLTYTITIQNNENEEMYINDLRVKIPQGALVTAVSSLEQKDIWTYTTTDSIKTGEKKEYKITLVAPYIGEYMFKTNIELEVKGEHFFESDTQTIEANSKQINCYLSFNQQDLVAGKIMQYGVILKNNDPNEIFYNIEGTYTTPEKEIPFSKNQLETLQYETITNDKYLIPYSTEKQKIEYSIFARYNNIKGQEFFCNETIALNIPASNKVVVLEITPNKFIFNRTEKAEFTIKVTKNIDVDIDTLLFSDHIKTGRKGTFKQIQNQTKDASTFSYIVTYQIPEDSTENHIEFQTMVQFENESLPYKDTESVSITIQNPVSENEAIEIRKKINETNIKETQTESSETIEQDESQKEETKTTEVKKQENDGFVSKILQLIKNIFGKR